MSLARQPPAAAAGIHRWRLIAAALLVLRHGEGLLAPRHRRKPQHGARTGHQHRFQHGARSDGLQRSWSPSPARCSRSIRAPRDINMGRGAIVIGLAAVIIGEVRLRQGFHQTSRLKLLRRLHRRRSSTTSFCRSFCSCGLNTNDLKLITALIVAVFLAIPYWKSKMFRHTAQSKQKGGSRQCLNSRNIYKTFNPGTINAKAALSDLSLHAERRRLCHRHRRQRRGQVHDAQRHRGRVPDRLRLHSSSTASTSPELPEYKRAAFIGRVFQDPMMRHGPHACRLKKTLPSPPAAASSRGLALGRHRAEQDGSTTELLEDAGSRP